MKPLLVCLALLFAVALPVAAQDDREEFKRLSSDIETLIAANADLQRKISALQEELRSVREAQTRLANTADNRDELKHLTEKIQEVDKKRIADRDMIVEKMADMVKNLTATPPPRTSSNDRERERVKPLTGDSTKPVPDTGVEYVIQPGDILVNVLTEYNKEFRKQGIKPVSLKQLYEANPGLKDKSLKVGKKVFIPVVK